MTIDEAIRHCEEVAENYRYQRADAVDINDVGAASDCQQCADDHEQLAEWLTELKDAKNLLYETGFVLSRAFFMNNEDEKRAIELYDKITKILGRNENGT